MSDEEYKALVNAISDYDSDDGFTRPSSRKAPETPKKLVDAISDCSDSAEHFREPRAKKSKTKSKQKTLHHFFPAKGKPTIFNSKPSTSKQGQKRPFKPVVVTVEATPEEVQRYLNNRNKKAPCIVEEVSVKDLGSQPCFIERRLQESVERRKAQTMMSNRASPFFGTPLTAPKPAPKPTSSHIRVRKNVELQPDVRRSASPKSTKTTTPPPQNLPPYPLNVKMLPLPKPVCPDTPARAVRVARSESPKTFRKSESPVPSTSAAAIDSDLSASVNSLHLESVQYSLAPDLRRKMESDVVFVDFRSIESGRLPEPFPRVCTNDTYGWGDPRFIKLPFSSSRLLRDRSSAAAFLREELTTLTEPQTSIQKIGAVINHFRQNPLNYDSLYTLFAHHLTPEQRMRYLNVVIPRMAKLALRLNDLIKQPIPRLERSINASLTFSQEQVACLLSHSFFCTFPLHHFERREYMPYMNFNTLFSRGRRTKIEKLKCILHYFDCVTDKMPDGVITIRRNHSPKVCFGDMTDRLCDLLVHEDGRIEDTNNEMLEIDFANEFIGGGVLGDGCVQEEIRFIISPELLVSLLFCERMENNESISIVGTQRFCDYQGYGESFRYIPRTQSGSVIRDRYNRITSEVVAIDAILFRKPRMQFEDYHIHREMTKAYTGFDTLDDLNRPIATGNWGCGVFGGDRQLKSLIQLAAASARGRKEMHYFTFNDAVFTRDLRRVYRLLVENGTTVGMLVRYILAYRDEIESGGMLSLFSYIAQELSLATLKPTGSRNDNALVIEQEEESDFLL